MTIPPQVFNAEDQETLNWVLALRFRARIPGHELADGLREALQDELWGDAVEMWMQNRPEVDVYPSFELYTERHVELASQEFELTPLFKD